MYKTENLERLSNYIMATVYTHNPKKITSLKKQMSSLVTHKLPQAVKANDAEKTGELLNQIASALNVSDKDFKKILHGNFLSVLRLMEHARKKVHDGSTLLRYLEVIAHVNGTTLPKISKELGRKSDSYIANLALHDQYPTRKRVLCRGVSLFGVSLKAMADAVSRSRIKGTKPRKKESKPKRKAKGRYLKVIPDDDFNDKLDLIRDDLGLPPNFMEMANNFISNLRHRKYAIAKGATKMFVHTIHVYVHSIVTVPVSQAILYALKVVYPTQAPKNLIHKPAKYRKERQHVENTLLNAKTIDGTITIVKNYFRIDLDNSRYIKIYMYNFSWPLKEKNRMSSSISLQAYSYRKRSAKVRRLLKKYNR